LQTIQVIGSDCRRTSYSREYFRTLKTKILMSKLRREKERKPYEHQYEFKDERTKSAQTSPFYSEKTAILNTLFPD